MNRSAVLTLTGTLLFAGTSGADGPTAAQVHSAVPSVHKVWGRSCTARGQPVEDKFGTGFSVDVGGTTRIVTALHVLAGCKKKAVEDAQQSEFDTEVLKVFAAADLVLIKQPAKVSGDPLAIASTPAGAGDPVVALGYGQTGTFKSKSFPVRLSQNAVPASNNIASSVPGNIAADFLKQGFPDPTRPFVDLDGALFHGDSGCPILNANGEVVAVGNGGVMGGALPISWGFPASNLADLYASSVTQPPSDAKLVPALQASKLGTGTFAGNANSSTVSCGSQSFQLVGRRRFDEVLRTADALSVQHVNIAKLYAMQAGKPLTSSDQFDVYVDQESGGTIVLPKGFTLTPQGDDCVAQKDPDDVELRYTSFRAADPLAATPGAQAFIARCASADELVQINPTFSMPVPVARVDGMAIQRLGFFITDGTLPPNEGYATHAFRSGVYLGALVHTGAPLPATRATDFYRAVAAVYLTAFAL